MRTYGSLHVVIRPLLPIQPVINSCPSSFPSLCFNQAQRLCSVITTNSSRTLLLLNGGRKRNFRERTFSTPFAKEDKLFFFLPARRETVIKFHEFRAPVNVGRVKSKFKLCRKSDPIPSSLQVDGSVQGPLIPDKKGKSLGRRNEFFFCFFWVLEVSGKTSYYLHISSPSWKLLRSAPECVYPKTTTQLALSSSMYY